VFCLEWPDVEGGRLRHLQLLDDAELGSRFREDLLRGVQVVEGSAVPHRLDGDGERFAEEPIRFTAIPYYAWAHRGPGEMRVWLARESDAAAPLGQPTLASRAKVAASYGKTPSAVNDLLEPKGSGDHDVPFFHWWPHKGTKEWIEYDFGVPSEVSSVEVFWFDDTGRGECRLPQSWRVVYRDGDDWKPVGTEQGYGVEPDRYNRVVFETARTTKLRLEVQSRNGWAGGIHEWRVK
jgi:hypothetical protein